MGKWIIAAVLIVAVALSAIVLVYLLNKAYKNSPIMNQPYIAELPEIVKVTVSDSLYHDLTCEWAGRGAKEMKLEDAIILGFHPCPDCIGEE